MCHRKRPSKFNEKIWYKNTRIKIKQLAMDYLGNKCKLCGVDNLHMACYCFHHRNKKDKKCSIGSLLITPNFDKIKKELDKCDLLCANCHALLHWGKI